MELTKFPISEERQKSLLKAESKPAPPSLKKINVSGLLADGDAPSGIQKNFSLLRTFADKEVSKDETSPLLGKRMSSIYSRNDASVSRTPFFKNLQIGADFTHEKEAPLTGQFNQIDYSQ